MSKVQTRRTVSLNRAVFDAATAAAAARGMSLSHFVTKALEALGVEAPPAVHVPAPKPLLQMTREDVEAVLAPRVVVTAATPAPPGPRKPKNRTCAHCGFRDGAAFDEDGLPVCGPCATSFGKGTWGQR